MTLSTREGIGVETWKKKKIKLIVHKFFFIFLTYDYNDFFYRDIYFLSMNDVDDKWKW